MMGAMAGRLPVTDVGGYVVSGAAGVKGLFGGGLAQRKSSVRVR
jgi:hypothetical protein